MKFSFNLIDEGWIPCVTTEGKHREYSIREVFHEAHAIREVHSQSPLVVVSLYRFLLAILHRVLGPESEEKWLEIYKSRKWDLKAIDAYLDQWHDRFDLFHEKYPFYQVSDFPREKASRAARLAIELASGNNDTLFDHNWDDNGRVLSPSQAARYLLTTPNYGLTGVSASVPQSLGLLVDGVAVLIRGQNFWETLTCNLVTYNKKDEPFDTSGADMPLWEKGQHTFIKKPPESDPVGYLDYLTFQSRYIQLFPPKNNGKTCVHEVGIAQGRRFLTEWQQDQFKVYIRPKEGAIRPLRHDVARALWRDMDALLGVRMKSNLPEVVLRFSRRVADYGLDRWKRCNLEVFGVANKQSNILMWRRERLPVPVQLLTDDDLRGYLAIGLSSAEEKAVTLAKVVSALNRRLLAEKKVDNPPIDPDSVRQSYWNALEPAFCRFLESLPSDAEESTATWHETIKASARDAFDSAVQRLRFTARALESIVIAERKLRMILAGTKEQRRSA